MANNPQNIDRVALVQAIIDKGGFSTYLEIGSRKGHSLLPIRCRHKIAVDPRFQISKKNKIKWILKNPCNIKNKYFAQTSDDFFAWIRDADEAVVFDVVFIDGLHTFAASLRDVLNALPHLNPNGAIILHDCFPSDEAMALPLKKPLTHGERLALGLSGPWCGDVWKSIVYLRRNLSAELQVIVLDVDFGLGVVRVKEAIGELAIDPAAFGEIDQMTYAEMARDPGSLLGLQGAECAATLIDSFAPGP